MSNHTVVAEEYRKKYENYIADLRFTIEKLQKDNDKLSKQAVTGAAFEQMMKAVHENALVKASWDKFMMTLRMSGYDEN